MPETNRRSRCVLLTHGADHELSSVGFNDRKWGHDLGTQSSVFLTSAAVDLARKRATTQPMCIRLSHWPSHEGLSGTRRYTLGLYSLREGARLHARRP